MTKYQHSGSELQNPQFYVQVHSQNRYKALAGNLHYPHFVILKQIQYDDD
jgi:hypothetical protein